jgi:hypothetical protein
MSNRMMYRSIIRVGGSLASMTAVAQFDERLREARRENDALENTGQALAEALKLQQNTRQRATADGQKRGRRRKQTDVIDLDRRVVIRTRRRRYLLLLLIVETIVAAIAVAVLITYLVTQRSALL